MTLPGGSAPFAWFAVAATSFPAMMVSAFPVADDDAGLNGVTKFLKMEASASKFATLDSFKAPGQPGTPTAVTSDNAKMLALGAASALIFVTLA
jgi:heme exporter protein D